VERSGAFWLRFYTERQNNKRVKVTEHLADKGSDFPSIDCRALDLLRETRMAKINSEAHKTMNTPSPPPAEPPMTIGAFWVNVFEPWVKANGAGAHTAAIATIGGYISKLISKTKPSETSPPWMLANFWTDWQKKVQARTAGP